MFGGGKGMGGGAGSGSMLRLVGRTVATARAAGVTNHPQDPASSPTSASNTSSANSTTSPRAAHKFNPGGSNSLGLSSASGSPLSAHTGNVPVSANNSFCHAWLSPFSGDDYVWVALDGSDEEKPPPPPPGDGFLLGPVPSSDEVTDAVSALTQVFGASSYSQFVRDKFTYSADKDVADLISSPNGLPHQVLSVGAEFDWPEPSSHLCNPRMLCSYGSDRVYDAFHLLQTEPSVQRMVISLSSDEAVWDAVLNNEVVRELRETYYAEEKLSPPSPESSDETHDNSNPAMDSIRWIFDNTRAKFVEVFEKITNLVNQLFKPPNDEKTAGATSPFEERIRTSFLLSIVVLLVVVLTRAQRA